MIVAVVPNGKIDRRVKLIAVAFLLGKPISHVTFSISKQVDFGAQCESPQECWVNLLPSIQLYRQAVLSCSCSCSSLLLLCSSSSPGLLLLPLAITSGPWYLVRLIAK